MALTKEGYRRETYEDILNRMETKAREVFGDNVNTATRVVVGMILRVVAFALSYLHQDIEDVYHSNDRSKAEGEALDVHASNLNTTRRPATVAWGRITFLLDETRPVAVPAGTICVNERTGAQYYTTETITIEIGNVGEVEIVALEAGASGNANPWEITQLLNPIAGIADIQNNEAITNGEDIESDASLKHRLSVIAGGANSVTARAIESRLLEVGGVRHAFVDENYNTIPSSYGTPPGNIQAFVIGGEPRDIAQAILDKKAAGIESYGEESYMIADRNGELKEMHYSRPTVKVISAFVDIVTNNTFSADGTRRINDIIFSAIGGYDAVNGVVHDSPLKMGQSVVVSKILAQIASVQGVDDVKVRFSTNGTLLPPQNVDVNAWEIAECDEVHVEVVDFIV